LKGLPNSTYSGEEYHIDPSVLTIFQVFRSAYSQPGHYETFNNIPSVLNARAGGPIMSERSIVDDSFDVGIIVEVRDGKGLQEYIDHPIHQKAKKEILLPLVERVLVYDFAK
jgi:hypothetical protein